MSATFEEEITRLATATILIHALRTTLSYISTNEQIENGDRLNPLRDHYSQIQDEKQKDQFRMGLIIAFEAGNCHEHSELANYYAKNSLAGVKCIKLIPPQKVVWEADFTRSLSFPSRLDHCYTDIEPETSWNEVLYKPLERDDFENIPDKIMIGNSTLRAFVSTFVHNTYTVQRKMYHESEATSKLERFILERRDPPTNLYINATPMKMTEEQEASCESQPPSPRSRADQTLKTFRTRISQFGIDLGSKIHHGFDISSKQMIRIDPWASLRGQYHPFLTAENGAFRALHVRPDNPQPDQVFPGIHSVPQGKPQEGKRRSALAPSPQDPLSEIDLLDIV
jgi:hypothetical protein